MLLTPFPGTIDFEKWASEDEQRADARSTACPITQHWLIPEDKRPKLYTAASDDVARGDSRAARRARGTSSTAGAASGRGRASSNRCSARVAFVLISKLYRQMYANTGIATDSARVARSARWARWMGMVCRRLFLGSADARSGRACPDSEQLTPSPGCPRGPGYTHPYPKGATSMFIRWRPRRSDARRWRIVGLVGVLLAGGAAFAAPGTVDDFFTNPIAEVTAANTSVAMVHQAVLPDGRLLLMGKEYVGLGRPFTAIMTPTPAWPLTPLSVRLTSESVPYDLPFGVVPNTDGWTIADTQICTGGAFTDSGSLFAAGGTRVILKMSGDVVEREYALGLSYSTEYSSVSKTWTRVPGNFQGVGEGGINTRWYPTTVRLGAPTGDRKMLIIGGSTIVDFTAYVNGRAPKPAYYQNRTVELFDNGVYRLISGFNQTPTAIWSEDYTHAYQMPRPGGEVLMFGQQSRPARLRLDGVWSVSPTVRPGTTPTQTPNDGATTALLPIRANEGDWGYSNGSVLTVGGDLGTDHERSADIYDPIPDTYRRIDLQTRRHYAALVTLPDSRMAIVAGHNSNGNVGVSHVQYYDPATGAVSTGAASMPEVRGYHLVASLLPDGRIVVGGGVKGGKSGENGAEQSTFRYYFPDYMSKVRPTITSASSARLGQPLGVMWSHPSPVRDAVLIALSSDTHSVDMNQRSVQLRLTQTTTISPTMGMSTFQLPSTLEVLPPGYYMLFILDGNRVPSTGKVLKVTS